MGVEIIVIMADLNRFSNRPIFVYKNTIVIHLLSDNMVISRVYQKKGIVLQKITNTAMLDGQQRLTSFFLFTFGKCSYPSETHKKE